MLSVTYKPFMLCRYAECRYAECGYAECRGAISHLQCICILRYKWRHDIEHNDAQHIRLDPNIQHKLH